MKTPNDDDKKEKDEGRINHFMSFKSHEMKKGYRGMIKE